MSVRDLTRSAALWIPRLRRYYEYVLRLSRDYLALHQENERLRLELADARQALSAAESAQEQAAQAVIEERESLRLQLYVLRSDFQRAVNKSDELRARLRDAEAGLEQARGETAARAAERDEVERRLAVERDELERRLAVERDELERRLNEANRLVDQYQVRIQELQTASAPATAADLEHSHARLLARLYVLGDDLSRMRRVIGREGNNAVGLEELRVRYLDFLEAALTGQLYGDPSIAPWAQGYDTEVRETGRDWPARAETMIGTARMRNIRVLAESVIEDRIEGDFIEAGVWRGGACIYMRGILAAYDIHDRRILVADSFAGLPPPDPTRYPADAGDSHHTVRDLAVSLDEVKSNFARYGFLDDQVVFLPGWFKDTLPLAPITKLAILRLDGDMYSSTIEALESTYGKLAPGGYVIIDDYILRPCRQAVHDFRKQYNVTEQIQEIDGAGVFWRKQS